MIKLVYVGEDDYMACLKNGDVFFAEAADDGSWYIIKNKNGEEIYLSKDEVVVY